MKNAHFAVLAQLMLVALLSGCAAGRSVVSAGVDSGQNPAQGVAVRIDRVEDARKFMVDPPRPDIPSLMDASQTNDKTITVRAIGRKRGGFGNALGDVLLPEGQTVPALVESAVARALRESGYRVLGRGSPDYARAVPVAVRIDEFWCWFNPGFASVTVSFKGQIFMRGALPQIAEGRLVSAHVTENMQMVLESDWQAVVNKGLEGLADATKNVLQPASSGEAHGRVFAVIR